MCDHCDVVVKKVHVRCLISWWVSCYVTSWDVCCLLINECKLVWYIIYDMKCVEVVTCVSRHALLGSPASSWCALCRVHRSVISAGTWWTSSTCSPSSHTSSSLSFSRRKATVKAPNAAAASRSSAFSASSASSNSPNIPRFLPSLSPPDDSQTHMFCFCLFLCWHSRCNLADALSKVYYMFRRRPNS